MHVPVDRQRAPLAERLQKALDLRNRKPALFSHGLYVPLEVTGSRKDHVLAFARHHGEDVSITIAPIRVDATLKDGGLSLGQDLWKDTAIIVPKELRASRNELLTGRSIDLTDTTDVSRILATLPCALLG